VNVSIETSKSKTSSFSDHPREFLSDAMVHSQLIGLVAAIFALGCGEAVQPTTAPNASSLQSPVQLVIDLGDEGKKAYAVAWEPELTVLSAMERAAKSSGLVFEHRHSGEMAFLDAIGSTRNEAGRDGRNWIYHVNGEQADVGFGSRKLKAGDVVVWRFQKYNP
jgi:hypothetical protein